MIILNVKAIAVSDIRFAPSGPDQRAKGLRGWVCCVVGRLQLDGLAVRRTLDGRLALSFPARTASDGSRHAYVRPLDDEARIAIETAVIDHLGNRGLL